MIKLLNIKFIYDYAILTFNYIFNKEIILGQYVSINNKLFTIIEQRNCEFDILVKTNSKLIHDKTFIIDGPFGDGFKNQVCKHALMIAEGTGIGVIYGLIKKRTALNLKSDLIFYSNHYLDLVNFLGMNIQTFSKKNCKYDLNILKDFICNDTQIFCVCSPTITELIKEFSIKNNIKLNLNI